MAFTSDSGWSSFGLGLPQSGAGNGLDNLAGNPLFLAGLGLLSAGRDRRIDPFQSAAQGLLTANQFQQGQEQAQQRRDLFGLQKQKYGDEQAARQRSADAQSQIQGLLSTGDQEGAAKIAIASGDPQLVSWGGSVLTPKTPAELQTFKYLQEHPEMMGPYQEFKRAAQKDTTPYYTPLPTSNGYVTFNNRTGRYDAASLPGMQPASSDPSQQGGGAITAPRPILPIAADVPLAGAKAAAEAAGKTTGEAGAKRDISSYGVTDVIQQAEDLLSGKSTGTKPTGSTAGRIFDSGAAALGYSTPGSRGASSLDVIAGNLVSKMPRMEGPQSDRDVEMYKQMAADVGNRSKPIEDRVAALNQLRKLVSKYDKSVQQQPDGLQSKRLKYNPATGKLE